MNLNQIINMFLRLIMRRAINTGINAGINAASNMGKKRKGQEPQSLGEDRYGVPLELDASDEAELAGTQQARMTAEQRERQRQIRQARRAARAGKGGAN